MWVCQELFFGIMHEEMYLLCTPVKGAIQVLQVIMEQYMVHVQVNVQTIATTHANRKRGRSFGHNLATSVASIGGRTKKSKSALTNPVVPVPPVTSQNAVSVSINASTNEHTKNISSTSSFSMLF
ncbi:uncharacterized protein LOC113763200 isoform X2 [Coffea eugenioides]|uniref:uncharacterized protein LOC113763200 isoform X2 n=1 Tax=Coffea eugenioides TaxID=49369 RepID=UPI000F610EF9|nr:uncharacterized protein LOC113763200 isoform X2 [Coffea eugenioides]